MQNILVISFCIKYQFLQNKKQKELELDVYWNSFCQDYYKNSILCSIEY